MKTTGLLFILIVTINTLYSQNKTPEMVLVEGGTFKMGNNESVHYDEFPTHLVTLNDFSIGQFEVTVEEYKGFCRTAGLVMPEGKPNMPATNVSWEEAVLYCNWLSRINRLKKYYKIIRDDKKKSFIVEYDKTANGFRLPTEAEWEYAARGGTHLRNFAYSGSNIAVDVAWYTETGKSLQPVGQKKSNDIGIYDMTGNAQEWCFDIYNEKFYKMSPKENPVCKTGGTERISRGGNFNGHEETLRITKRFYNASDFRDETIGFRVVKNE